MAGLVPAIHVFSESRYHENADARDKPGHDEKLIADYVAMRRAYAVAMSGKTASILVFSVAALNGLTM